MAEAAGDPDFEFNPIDALDNSDFSDTCEYDDRLDHQHTIYGITYTGALDIWRNCDGEDNTFVVLSAASDPVDHGVTLYYLAVDDADYEAFDVLERSFYVNTEGVADLIEEAMPIDGGESGANPDDFVSFIDDGGTFALTIPKAWDDIINDEWVVDGDVIGRSLYAAPDIAEFEKSWLAPGLFVGTSASLAETYTPEEALDFFDYSDECTYDERYEYEDGYLLGAYDIWRECAEVEGQSYVVFSANPLNEDGEIENGQLAILYSDLVSQGDVDAFIEIMATLVVASADGEMESSAAASLPTATIVTNALNVRNGPGTNYARVAAVYQDDEVTVAGQSGNCAWLQVVTPDGQPGWVSGKSTYVELNGACEQIPEAEIATPQSSAGGRAASSAKGCYLFQNQLGTELTLTFTQADTKQNVTFKIPARGEQQQCFDPGPYTYTLDAPPPWGSTNGELTVSAGDNYTFPISGD